MILNILRQIKSKRTKLKNRKFLNIGNSIDMGIVIRTDVPVDRKLVQIGDGCVIGGTFIFESDKGDVIIGDNTYIGGCTLISRSSIIIGDYVQIAWGTYLYDHNAHSTDLGARRQDIIDEYESLSQGESDTANKDWSIVTSKPIIIEDDVWIGMNAVILKGVTVGRGAIIGAGSVVRRTVPPFCVVYGNPAKVVRFLYREDEIEAVQKRFYGNKYDFIDKKKYKELMDDYLNKEI